MNHRRTPRRAAAAGFTLIEMLAAVGIVGVLASIAYPSLEAPIQKARRSDALVSLMSLQMAQERWRSNNRRYASLDELGVAARSAHGHYTLQVESADDDGYVLQAVAAGAQARDRGCRWMKVIVRGADVQQASGADANAANASAQNRRCWGL